MKWAISCLALLTAASSQPAIGRASGCQDAIRSYSGAVDEISSTLRRYASCVESSRGQDDCSFEFGRIRSAQWDFESAVSSYKNECE